MKIDLDKDIDEDNQELQTKHFTEVRKRMAENLEKDDIVAKQRIKEKRLKVKKRIRREAGEDEGERQEEEQGMMLASASASEQDSASDNHKN